MFAVLVPALLLPCVCGGCRAQEPPPGREKIQGNPLRVEKVENLPDDFILGVDASSVIAEEDSGVVYRDFDGEPRDVFETLAEAGVTHIRVRIWNDPYDPEGRGYGGGSCDTEKAARIGVRAARAGMGLIVDYHYSDFWADPGKQAAPKAWAGMRAEEKADALYEFTSRSLRTLLDAGADVAMVQLGNETNGALCGERDWDGICLLMDAGSRAVREVCPGARVAVHFTNPEKAGTYAAYAAELDKRHVDYDVFASSYYPFWHGTTDGLASVLTEIARRWGKQVMVMETSWPYTAEDSDYYGNTVSAPGPDAVWPFSPQGQADALREVIDAVANRTENGIGVVYWEGTWIAAGGGSRAENEALWETYGSGWATRFAAGYDPEDAGRWYGGNAVDNQALFAPDGTPLPSLQAFNLVYFGNDGA